MLRFGWDQHFDSHWLPQIRRADFRTLRIPIFALALTLNQLLVSVISPVEFMWDIRCGKDVVRKENRKIKSIKRKVIFNLIHSNVSLRLRTQDHLLFWHVIRSHTSNTLNVRTHPRNGREKSDVGLQGPSSSSCYLTSLEKQLLIFPQSLLIVS